MKENDICHIACVKRYLYNNNLEQLIIMIEVTTCISVRLLNHIDCCFNNSTNWEFDQEGWSCWYMVLWYLRVCIEAQPRFPSEVHQLLSRLVVGLWVIETHTHARTHALTDTCTHARAHTHIIISNHT